MSCPIRPRSRPENLPGCPPAVVPSVGDSSTIVGDPILRDLPPTPGETALITKYHPLYVYLVDLFAHSGPSDVYYGEAAIFHDVQGGPWWPAGVPMTPAAGYRVGLTNVDYLAIIGLAAGSSYWDDIDPERQNLALMWAIREYFLTQYSVDLARFHVEIRAGAPYRIDDPLYPQTRQAIVLRELPLHCSERECYIPGEIDPENDYRYYVADQLIASMLRRFTDHQVGVTDWGRTCEWAGEFDPSLARGYLHNGYTLINVAQVGWVLHLGRTLFDKWLRNCVGIPDPDPTSYDPAATPPVDPTDTPPPNYHASWTNFAHFGRGAFAQWLRYWIEFNTGLREDTGTFLTSGERFDYSLTEVRALLHPSPLPRLYHTATWFNPGNLVLVAGGWSKGQVIKTADLYSVTFGVWTHAPDMSQARALHTATETGGTIVVIGGIDGNGTPLVSTEIFNNGAHTWSSGAPMVHPRYQHTATPISGGSKIVVAGGWGPISGGIAATDCSQTYTVGTDTWAAPEPMLQGRAHHAAAASGNKAYVSGGIGPDGTVLNSMEMYTSPGGWQTRHVAPTARRDFTLNLLSIPGPSDYLLAIGGFGPGGVVLGSVDAYNLAADVWNFVSIPPLNYPRALHCTARISNTQLVVYGGVDQQGNPVANAELYDGVANTWTVLPQVTARKGATATSLGNTGGGGTVDVLFVGGDDAAAGPVSKKLHWAMQTGVGALNEIRTARAVTVRPQDDWRISDDVATVLAEYQRQVCTHAVIYYHTKWAHRWAVGVGGASGDQHYVDGRSIDYGSGAINLLDAPPPGDAGPLPPLPNPWAYMPSNLIHRHLWAPDLRRWDFVDMTVWAPTMGGSRYFLMCPWVLNWTDWFSLKHGCDATPAWTGALVQRAVESDLLDLLITGQGVGVGVQPWPTWRQVLNTYGGTWFESPPWANFKAYLDAEPYQLMGKLPISLPVAQQRNTPPPDPLWTQDVANGGSATFTLKERDVLLAVFEQYLADSPNASGLPADLDTVVWYNKIGNYSKYPPLFPPNDTCILDWSQVAITRQLADLIVDMAATDPASGLNPEQTIHAYTIIVLQAVYRVGVLKDDGGATQYTYDQIVNLGAHPTPVFTKYWRYWGQEVPAPTDPSLPPQDPQETGGQFRDIQPIIDPDVARFHTDYWQSSVDIDTGGARAKPSATQYFHNMITRALLNYKGSRGY